MRKRKQKQTSPLVMIAAFSFVILYLEIVFSLATVGGIGDLIAYFYF